MSWWLENNLRLIQTNFRDIDAGLNVDSLIDEVKRYECNVLMVNVGGITSFYPSALEYQVPSPYLNGRDTIGEIMDRCQGEGIRVIGRFDFSKTNERFYEQRREWYYQSAEGEAVRYNDTVHTCICGDYQTDYSRKVISEALSRYALSGVFLNYFGFVTRDYSGNYYGICHCDSCRQRFYDFSGLELPTDENDEDPSWDRYEEFKEHVRAEVLHGLHETVRSFDDQIALSTYHHKYVDIIREESNSNVDRPYPFWLYNSSSNVAGVRSNWNDKILSNCVINSVDLFCRFVGVSKELNRIRLYENMAEGSGLDYCIIGVFDGYPDRSNFAYAEEVFRFHKKNERYFGHLKSEAKVAVILPMGTHRITPLFSEDYDYLGLFKILKEEHMLFDVLDGETILSSPTSLDQYSMGIVPGLSDIADDVIVEVRRRGLPLILMAVTTELPEKTTAALNLQVKDTISDTRSMYLKTSRKDVFKHFADKDWLYLDKAFGVVDAPGYENLLPVIGPAMFGPPERCYGHEETSMGAVLATPDRTVTCVPWHLGKLYYSHGFEDHKHVLVDLIDYVDASVRVVTTDAPACVELFWNQCGEGEYLLQLLNLSGFNGTTVGRHIPIHAIEVTVPVAGEIEAESLMGNTPAVVSGEEGTLLTVERLEEYDAIVVRTT